MLKAFAVYYFPFSSQPPLWPRPPAKPRLWEKITSRSLEQRKQHSSKKCKKDACEPKAVGSDGKPRRTLSGLSRRRPVVEHGG